MLLHGWVVGELGVGTDEQNSFSLVFQHDDIEIAYLASVITENGYKIGKSRP